jgi:hypothetical protein
MQAVRWPMDHAEAWQSILRVPVSTKRLCWEQEPMPMTKQRTTRHDHFVGIVFGTTLALLAVPVSAAAQSAGSSDTNAWQFQITPYLFNTGLDGKTGVSSGLGDVSADDDMSFGDILDNLDSGFMALFEAHKGKWMLALEGVYFKLKHERASSWRSPRVRVPDNWQRYLVACTWRDRAYAGSAVNAKRVSSHANLQYPLYRCLGPAAWSARNGCCGLPLLIRDETLHA